MPGKRVARKPPLVQLCVGEPAELFVNGCSSDLSAQVFAHIVLGAACASSDAKQVPLRALVMSKTHHKLLVGTAAVTVRMARHTLHPSFHPDTRWCSVRRDLQDQ